MVAETTSTFGTLLRRYRVAAGLTQEALAERAGLSVYGVQKLERGITHPYRDTATRLASALELAPDEADRFRALVEPVRRRGSAPREGGGGERRHNLPVALTSFVGREQELASLPHRLGAARLLTLTGVGGSGKTRLAIEVARRITGEYPDGVQLVEFAPVTDPSLVPDRVATILGIPTKADRPLEHALADAMRNTQQLLVLDNCEHLLNACAVLVDFLLRECPTLQILATSREPIGIAGEVTWSVAPLEPPDELSGSVSEIERSPAVRLFVERAAAAQSSFVLTAENADTVGQICRRLDGMPLALELAAARLDALTPHQLATRLDQRFALLTGGNRAALPRQQTLSATIEWSYQLLTETQQRVFERLAVFTAGWTLEAAEAVCAGDGVAESDVLDALLQLTRKSLVARVGERQGAARYGLLETVRQYAWDRLAERGPELAAVRERHAAYYSGLVQRLDPAYRTTLLPFSGETLSAPVFEILDDTHDNVRLALRWWLDNERAEEGLLLIRALGPLWMWRGVPVDGRRWFEAMLNLAAASADKPGFPRAVHAHALFFGGIVARMQADYDKARTFSEASVALWRTLGDPVGLVQALNGLGFHHTVLGDFEQADKLLSEALALARSVGDALPLASALFVLGNLCRVRRQYEDADALLRESMTIGRAIERPSYQALSVTRSLMFLARTESERGASKDAISLFKQALTGIREWSMAGDILACCLDWLAADVCKAGDPLRAARLFGAAEAQWRRAGAIRSPLDQSSYENEVSAVREQLDEAAFALAWNDGRAMEMARVFAVELDETD